MLSLREIQWHRPLARRPRLMVVLGLVLPLVCVVAAWQIGEFVRWRSGNDVLNYVLMIGHVLLCLVSGWVLAMVVATWLLGDDWRASFLTGEAYSVGDAAHRMMQQSRDRSALFVGLALLAAAGIYGASVLAGGNFLFRYDRFAAPMTAVRSDSVELQARGLLNLARDADYDERETLAIRKQVLQKLTASDDDVRAHAAWAAGQVAIIAARDRLVALLEDPAASVRAEAALALARLHVPGTAELLANSFPDATPGSESLEEAWIVALGLTGSRDVGAFLVERFDRLASTSRFAAFWAIGASGDTCQHRFLMEATGYSRDYPTTCAIADALKKLSVEEDVPTLQQWVTPEESHWCKRQIFTGLGAAVVGSRDVVVLSAQESLREKYMDAVFNTAADNIFDWYDQILRDERYSNTAREHAYFLMQKVRKTPTRSVRRATGCGGDSDHEPPARVPVRLGASGDDSPTTATPPTPREVPEPAAEER